MKTLINDIIKRLGDARHCEPDPQPLFQHADLDWGQVDFYEGWPPPVKFPAALIGVIAAEPSNQGHNIQIDVVQIQVRIIDLILSGSGYRVPDEQREAAFRTFDLINAANSLLHGWTGSKHYGPLTRAGFKTVNRSDGLREYRMEYKVQLTNNSAEKVFQLTTAKPVVKLVSGV